MAARVLLLLALTLTACSSVPTGLFTPLEPPRPGRHVELQYLGNGGWLITRDAEKIATAPFVSNPNALTLPFPGGPNKKRIRDDTAVPPMHDVRTILVGHGHYDHAMDLPYVHETKAPNADIYGSTTVVNTLGAVRALDGYLKPVEYTDAAGGDHPGRWLTSRTPNVRFLPLRSTHAPHVLGLKLLPWWNVDEKQTALPCCPAWWKEGQTLAFLIDFLDASGRTEFRIYYQDSASKPGTGIAPVFAEPDRAPVDVAILCVASFDHVENNPEHVLANLQPRYVIGGHWEDFFVRPYGTRPVRPVVGTDLEAFHRRVKAQAPGPIYLPEPGQKVYIPIAPRP